MEKKMFNPNDFSIDKETGLFYNEAIHEWCVDWEVIRKVREEFCNDKDKLKLYENEFYKKVFEKSNGQEVITVYYEGFNKYNGTGEYIYLISKPDKKTYLVYDGSFGPGIDGYKKQEEWHENMERMMIEHPEDFLIIK